MKNHQPEEIGEGCGHGRKEWLLLQGVKGLLLCDGAEVVRGIAGYVISQYGVLRIGAAFVERRRETFLAPAAAFLGAVTRFLEIRRNKNGAGAVWIARLDNERKAIEPFLAAVPELASTELSFRRRPAAAGLFALVRRLLPQRRRIFRLARRLLRRRHEFFKVLRVAELIGYYAHYLDIFEKNEYKLAVMSSHSNPHGIAFNLAARRCRIPVVLITHGMPVRPIARLSYDLAVVHCEAARRRYAEAGSRMERVLIHGRRQNYQPMPESPLPEILTIGIFLCKDVNERRLAGLVGRLLADRKVERIILRPHPKNLWRGFFAWLETLDDSRVGYRPGESAASDLSLTDVVFAGNSSVLIEAVTAGRPGAYVAGLDCGPPDLHEFVAAGLIYQFDETRGLEPDAMLRFYRRPGWIESLKYFANIEEDESAVALQTRTVLCELLGFQNPEYVKSER